MHTKIVRVKPVTVICNFSSILMHNILDKAKKNKLGKESSSYKMKKASWLQGHHYCLPSEKKRKKTKAECLNKPDITEKTKNN